MDRSERHEPEIRRALVDDADPLLRLVQSAYRGDASRSGWTTEADLIDGSRIDAPTMRATLEDPDVVVLVIDDEHGRPIACCELRPPGEDGAIPTFGMFAVDPDRQSAGLGGQLLRAAERVARDEWRADRLRLTVIDRRQELIDWYGRRGYLATGEQRPFPYGDDRFGTPRVDDLRFAVLERDLANGTPAGEGGGRRFDLVVHGATSFVGQILCRYLVAEHGTDGPLRWAISGRNDQKLREVAEDTGAEVERVVADSHDVDALEALVASTRVVVSTVGPYSRHGSQLVAAAVRSGTDYLDLTGETQWMRRMIDAHHDEAVASGARVVHACGFDSIPSDLGVWFTQQQSLERHGEPCERISMRVDELRGGASGGTVASMLQLVEEAAHDPELRRLLADPYALNPADQRSGPSQTEVRLPTTDPDAPGRWLAPFVMAAVNTRVVQRSHALLGRPWGEGFRYDEAMDMGRGPLGAAKASAVTAGLGGVMGLAAIGPSRRLLERTVLPSPGDGPSPAAQARGGFSLRFVGHTPSGATVTCRVTGDRDPGYGATARMLGEAAAVMLDLGPETPGGGFWTPATAFGDELIERLEARAGLRFEVLD